ncbi:MAG: peptide deformylase [Candidatus Neomarinimicrobiota bacterium]|nr:peptide deformylase [Candidatus Neomarinimicrobiota bacterium]MED5451679.1 peptide deformylase [Candidatus Neomarinimicrobiota bacterium]MEE3241717.1 peptide deformylase [Candidatus Neomarinimicrobiota bacterium]
MAVKKVVTYGHPVLRKVSSDITDFSNIDSLIQDLFDTMYEFDGIGLASNQIGIDKRIFVVDISHMEESDEESEKPLVFINGRIDNTVGSDVDSEGCLSLPEIRINVERYESIRYKYLDRDLNKHSKNFSGLLARIIQHENDHLDGKLITDYATPADLLKHGKALELMRTENTK